MMVQLISVKIFLIGLRYGPKQINLVMSVSNSFVLSYNVLFQFIVLVFITNEVPLREKA